MSKMLHRLEEKLKAFDFEIIYRKGKEMLSDLSSSCQLNPNQQQTNGKGPRLRRLHTTTQTVKTQ